jgi:hypothetical protein
VGIIVLQGVIFQFLIDYDVDLPYDDETGKSHTFQTLQAFCKFIEHLLLLLLLF